MLRALRRVEPGDVQQLVAQTTIESLVSTSSSRLQFNSLDNMALAGLWAALGGTTQADFEGEKYLLAHTQERWVFELPQDFVRRLSAVKPGAAAKVAMTWAKHEELVHMGADGPSIEPVIEAMSGFARQAIGEGKSLLLFMCL